jgi:hypothetical protein
MTTVVSTVTPIWLIKVLSFLGFNDFGPECPICHHLLVAHRVSGYGCEQELVEDFQVQSPSFGKTFWRRQVKHCTCELTQDDILTTLYNQEKEKHAA